MDCSKNSNTSLDTLLLNCDKEKKSSNKRKCSHKRMHTATNTNSTDKKCTSQQMNINCAEKHISQQIHVERQEFQCIINLNTTACEHKSIHRKKCDKKHRSKQSHSKSDEINKPKHSDSNCKVNRKESIVPQCFRHVCLNRESRRCRDIHRRINVNNTYHNRERKKITSRKDEMKQEDRRNSKHLHHRSRHSRHEKKQKSSTLFSPISSSPLKYDAEDNLTYENISNTSLITHVDKPTPQKRAKHCKHEKKREKGLNQETELDALIRRTRERERKLVLQFRSRPLYTSTPILDEISSEDFPMVNSDMDISLNSQSTLVLDTHYCFAYSPSSRIEDLHRSSETEKLSYLAYSPNSPTKNEDYIMKGPEIDFKLVNTKKEPMMDIEAYSPVQSPGAFAQKLSNFPAKVCVKKEVEVKNESFSAPRLSPYFEKNNSGLQFCTIENIKSEKDC